MLATDLVLQSLDLFLYELEDLAALDADQVLVMLAAEGRLVERPPIAQRMSAQNAGLDQSAEGAEDGRSGDRASFSMERREKLLGVEVPEVSEGVVEDPPALGGDPETPFTQPPLKVADVACHGPDPF